MTPKDRAAEFCAALIRDGSIKEDGYLHHRIHDALVEAFAACGGPVEEPPPAYLPRYLDGKGNPV